ncbi:DNA-directed RNA polymerase I subunit RPA12 [Scaptodrosophila lebanonensis]|uniref:DNA-directed RNA polymerase subunit n=1 Tax=Drosophila lebanonensis TaxID=7225 RepID=A0A6J2TLZ3_DROLE|nr:DNA-directed RNA polymerase I subunit RPA12 [Scaptodrosophila lebanonensis]
MEVFNNRPGFCPSCGSILPPLQMKGNVVCFNCKQEFLPDVYIGEKTEFTIQFNTYDPTKIFSKAKRESRTADSDGPVVERKCPKCGHDKMSYATLQLRSADEGQTVFFTCLQCKYKESENS